MKRKKQTIPDAWKHKSNEKPKARKHDHSWASAEIFPGVQGQHVIYHFQIADDLCSL